MTGIVGHKTPMAELVGSLSSPRLHHAWLFAGDQGIGKATVARAFAQPILHCRATAWQWRHPIGLGGCSTP